MLRGTATGRRGPGRGCTSEPCRRSGYERLSKFLHSVRIGMALMLRRDRIIVGPREHRPFDMLQNDDEMRADHRTSTSVDDESTEDQMTQLDDTTTEATEHGADRVGSPLDAAQDGDRRRRRHRRRRGPRQDRRSRRRGWHRSRRQCARTRRRHRPTRARPPTILDPHPGSRASTAGPSAFSVGGARPGSDVTVPGRTSAATATTSSRTACTARRLAGDRLRRRRGESRGGRTGRDRPAPTAQAIAIGDRCPRAVRAVADAVSARHRASTTPASCTSTATARCGSRCRRPRRQHRRRCASSSSPERPTAGSFRAIAPQRAYDSRIAGVHAQRACSHRISHES